MSKNTEEMDIEGLLINLIEEAAEVAQMGAKCLRFGLDGYNPNDPKRTPNRVLLAREIGNFTFIGDKLITQETLPLIEMVNGMLSKEGGLKKYPLIIKGRENV